MSSIVTHRMRGGAIARTLGVGVALAMGARLHAQQPLLSNASSSPFQPALDLRSQTGSGVPSGSGPAWSEVASAGMGGANALAGVACHEEGPGYGYVLADDFEVPAPGWRLSRARVFAYRPGWTSQFSPVLRAGLEIWSGLPYTQGSTQVWGDLTTDALRNSQALGACRVFTTTVGPLIMSPDTSRLIFEVDMNVAVSLAPGRYWMVWRLTPSEEGAWLFSPTATVPGQRTLPEWNARQAYEDGWTPILDPGKPASGADVPQDLPFQLMGEVGNVCDSTDFNADGLDQDPTDLEAFFSVYSGGPCVPVDAACGDVDFNNDGLEYDPTDLETFFSVYSGGPCI